VVSDEKKYTERDLVMAKREAFVEGAVLWRCYYTQDSARAAAERRHPLPKVTRPRVVADPHDGEVMWSYDVGGFRATAKYRNAMPLVRISEAHHMTHARAEMWADLLANPLEEVDDA
jgi:hypothetical protein